MSWNEAVAEANAASPPDAPILKRARRTRSSALRLSRTPAKTRATMAFPLRTPSPFWSARGLSGQPRWFYGVAGAYFSGGQLPFSARTPQPASLDGQQPGGERAEILRMVHQMADEIRALKARVEAVHAQSTSEAQKACRSEAFSF
jgi:hypothetical protein